ncbi:MAG TPA: CheR family methyltransferase [Micromonosporaceae bacterium]|nr:CheR family methyltransferase [Micromonosporaceae bacterium]
MNQREPQFEALLLYLKEARGFDFTGYKRSSLMRRVGRRMSEVKADGYAEYLDYLQVHPDEFTVLFNTILINVTDFFRDPEAWEHLREHVLPAMLSGREGHPVRVWSAGCASGEEAYTIAIVLAEMLGADEFRRRVKIYATDVDEESLAQARQASYSERDIGGVAADLRERYFESNGNRYTFRPDLRRSVIFGRNDLVQDAPISRVDLLLCRNTLMYFNSETQSRILSRFHFALAPHGFLFLGKAEMLLSHTNLFAPIDLKHRLFRKIPPVNSSNGAVFGHATPPSGEELSRLDRLHSAAFTASPVAQVVVTAEGLVALTNRQSETTFGISNKDVGRPFNDLDLSYRPVELRGYIAQAQLERRPIRLTNVEYVSSPGEMLYLEVQINPLVDSSSNLLGVALIFTDVTSSQRLRDELEQANRDLENAYEELQSTNEELETTNEELQSTVEELETTNEELQSTNEELETMNEELQSINEELRTVNADLRDRTLELDKANAFLDAILASMRAGVAVLDRDMHVRLWNRRAEDLWGLRPDEAIGQHFLNLDIGLPTDRLRPMIRQLLSGGSEAQELRLGAVNRRGRSIEVRVVGTPLGRTGDWAILLMDQAGWTSEILPPAEYRQLTAEQQAPSGGDGAAAGRSTAGTDA